MEVNRLLIREYRAEDRTVLAHIYQQSRVKTFYWLDISAYGFEDFDRDTKEEKILVALLNGEVAGFLSIWMPDNFIHHLYIHPGFVNKGIGKALLNVAIKLFDSPLRLKCLERNENAIAFYLSQGWIVQGEGVDANGAYLELTNPT
ncbi:GNAT family N-acetyltransferase [Mucilaginibacter sp. ZT4R22]|uniref:GNAT family N-acetyltransferase n=1 Tax=Mucilaginibacter pankratovii TaxID=2772110 RepID=A0ABR7WNW9_9SPHI|nr:GNAT family N-acetyltransferase [Mucilaginibacter pankratovii]MBD1364004.1 GNAT family N-acetyltransferase [Mucilaginibacter pankratovii]